MQLDFLVLTQNEAFFENRALLECAHFQKDNSFFECYGGFHWFPRNNKPRTWSDPEGSSHSGRLMCRGVADGSHHH
jgi:hypothetical protein